MIEYGFVRAIFVGGVVAIVLQCAVYPVRRVFGIAAAARMLRLSLYGFLGLVVACLVWGTSKGELSQGLEQGGLRTLADIGLFMGLAMFVASFMASRYLADELERRSTNETAAADGCAPGELESES